jgi:poly-gamma-glutamate synthesis protein (capsule biosynthesis protein)
MDYGAGPMLATIDMYDQRGWLHFGGGRDLTDATQVVKIIHNGNKLAFLGCNKVGPPHDWATETSPGAAPCDYEQMKASIAGLRSQGYLPVVTQQYNEYYLPYPTDNERQDFQALAEAGALIVSGSQGHYPATMEFDGGSFIHYGLGNLFFDQMRFQLSDGSFTDNTRKGFIDRHIFYNGRYVSTEILTYIIEDYAQPRPMTETERLQFLEMIFSNAEK